ncbi:Sec translocon accessory complex subunit YajC [Azospirillaceae bacterium]
MFVSTAHAQAASAGASPGADLMSFVPLVLIFIVFYFLLIRPQQKRMKDHKEMLTTLRRGDRVVTGGGLIGTVSKIVGDDEVVLELAENVKVRAVKSTLQSVLAKTEPVRGGKSDDDDDKEAAVKESKDAREKK